MRLTLDSSKKITVSHWALVDETCFYNYVINFFISIFFYSYMVAKVLFWSQISKMEILMNLNILKLLQSREIQQILREDDESFIEDFCMSDACKYRMISLCQWYDFLMLIDMLDRIKRYK